MLSVRCDEIMAAISCLIQYSILSHHITHIILHHTDTFSYSLINTYYTEIAYLTDCVLCAVFPFYDLGSLWSVLHQSRGSDEFDAEQKWSLLWYDDCVFAVDVDDANVLLLLLLLLLEVLLWLWSLLELLLWFVVVVVVQVVLLITVLSVVSHVRTR